MILKKELQRIRDNPQYITSFESALAVLEDHRIIYFLRAFGRPIRDVNSTHEYLASEGAYNAGWQDCLDALVNFKEMFITVDSAKHNSPKADYGGRRSLVEEGVFTEEELKHGRSDSRSNAAASSTKP